MIILHLVDINNLFSFVKILINRINELFEHLYYILFIIFWVFELIENDIFKKKYKLFLKFNILKYKSI